MNYPVATSSQLRAVLRGMRKTRGFSQAQVGQMLGVNQKRMARIESAPEVTSFDQISRLVAALGGRLVVEMPDDSEAAIPGGSGAGAARSTKVSTTKASSDSW